MIHTVIHFIEAEIFGGCEEVALLLLAGLDRRRWRPILFHHDAPGILPIIKEVDRLDIPSCVVPRITSGNPLSTTRRFISTLRAAKPAVFHAHLNWPLGCRHPLVAARLGRVPAIVATAHLYSSVEAVTQKRLKLRIQNACVDQYLAVSNEVRERFCQDLRVPESKMQVVRNGIRLTPFRGAPDIALRARIAEGSERPIVFTPARLHEQKGHQYLLEAARMVPDALFVLAGDGPEREKLEAQVHSLGIQSRVRFLGQRNDIPQLLAICDLFVLPSLYEGLPLSVLEAMAAGRPVVATKIGGTDEAVIDGVTGLLVSPADPVGLADAINRILGDTSFATLLANAGLARAGREFSSDVMVRNVADVYERLLDRSAARASN